MTSTQFAQELELEALELREVENVLPEDDEDLGKDIDPEEEVEEIIEQSEID